MNDDEISLKIMQHYLEEGWEVEEAIIERINDIYFIGEEMGLPPKFLDYELVRNFWLDDDEEFILIDYGVFVGEWITEQYSFPYKLFLSENPLIEMQKMVEFEKLNTTLKSYLKIESNKEKQNRNAEIQRINEIEVLKILQKKYKDEI